MADATPTLKRAVADVRWYANGMARVRPDRYEIRQTTDGVEVRLSDACRVVLDALADAEQQTREARQDRDEWRRAHLERVRRRATSLPSRAAAEQRAARVAAGHRTAGLLVGSRACGERWRTRGRIRRDCAGSNRRPHGPPRPVSSSILDRRR
jgi:hypothetical protein